MQSRAYTWYELTNAEQAEAMERGFPRGANIRYWIEPNATSAWRLLRWERQS